MSDIRQFFILSVLALSWIDATPTPNPCLNGDHGRYPHQKCHQYYDCDVTYEQVPPLLQQHVVECKYPQLYNTDTQMCDDFENVKCGQRDEYIQGCDYVMNVCDPQIPPCEPCYLAFPDCEGLSDGTYAISYKIDHYAVCRSERFIELKQCGVDLMGEVIIYNEKTNDCEKRHK